MAKIVTFIPEPKSEYNIENQRLINLALTQIIERLNTSYTKDVQNESERFAFFMGSSSG